MISILVVIACVLAAYGILATVQAIMQSHEIDYLNRAVQSLHADIRVIRDRRDNLTLECSRLKDRITELETAANVATNSLLECFEVRDDRPNSMAHKPTTGIKQ